MAIKCSCCGREFSSQRAADQHMNDKNHFPYECRCCDETWPTEAMRETHEYEDHRFFYCEPCDRSFMNLNNLEMHRRSRAHLGGNSIDCPFCRAGYATATGLTHHLERGACPRAPDLERDALYRFVRSKDLQGRIAKNILSWPGSSPQTEATDAAWNGRAYECYFCPREFRTLASLNQHLGSPIHQQNLYHCPHGPCRKDFKTLAALINHFESESCGFIRFSQVQKSI